MKISCPSETYPRIWQKKEWNNDMALDERKRAALDKFFKTKGPEDADFWRPSSDAADAAAYNAEIDRAVADAEQSSRFRNERNRQRRVDFLKGARIETPEPYVSGLSDEKRAALDRFFGFSAAARRASARPAGPQAPVTEMPETVVPTSSLLPSELPGDDGRQEPVVPDGELAARRAQSRKAALESSLDDVASGRIFGRGADESRPVPDTESLDWRDNIASAWRGILGGEVVEDLARVSGTLSPGAAELRRRDAARDAAFREYMEQELRRSGFEGMSADERIAAMENLVPAAGETLKAGGETFTPEEFGEHLDRYAKDIEHLERFAEDASYRNDWLLQHTGLTEERYRNKVADELEGRLNEIERKLPRPGGGNSFRGGYAAIGRAMNEKPSSETPAVREWMTKARDVVNTLRKDSFGSGLREGFDFGNVLTAGFKGLGDNVNLIRVLNAASRGEKLTPSQQALVDAWSTQQEAEGAINMLGGRSLGAGIGAGFSESLEFMTGMLATSGVTGAATAGLRKAATSAAARSAARAVAHEATKKGWKSAISKGLGKGAVRLSESVVGAAARTPLTGQLYKGYTDKRLGQFSAEERPDDDGIEKTIRKAPRGAWKDALEAYLETAMEYQSEDVGQWIGAGANALSRRVAQSRLGTLMGLKNFSGAKRNAALQWFKENAKITNFAGEVLGEAYGDAMVNLFEGNRQGWREMMTKDYWWTLGGVSALLSGPVGALGVPAQIRQARVVSGLSRLERKALASIENPELKDRMAKIAAMENITQRSRELAKLDWESKEITAADAVHVLDFINARTKLDALQGSETEDRRLTRFIPVLETLDQLQYRGADGKNSTGEMMYAADNSGNSYIVLSGDPASGDMLTVYDPVRNSRLTVPASEIAGWEKKGVSDVIAEEYALMFRVEANQEKLDNLFSRVREAAEAGVSDTALADMLLSEGIHVFKPGDEATLLDGQKVLVEDFSEGDYEVVLENGEKASVGLNEVLLPDAEAARAQQAAQTQDAGAESSASETVPDEVRQAGVQAEAMAREAVVSVRNADDDIVYTVDVEGSDEPVNILRGASLVYDPQTGAVDVPATLRRAQEQGLPETVAIRYADGKPGMVHISELQTVLEAADSEEVVREARTAAEQQAAAMQQDAAEAEPAGSVPEETEPTAAAADPLVGRSLTDEEAGQVIGQMEAAAEPAPELELTPENWMAQFGEEGKVQTPIGEVKMGENQYLKLLKTGREKYFGMIKPTLDTPDVVLEESDPQDGAERNSKYLFIKTFIKPDGSRYIHFESVTVRKDNLEVSVSSHEIDKGPFQKKMQNDRVLHLKKSLFDSEGRLTEPRMEGPDLVPTPRTSNGKDTTTIPENQTAKAEIPRQKNGQPDFNAMPADMLAVEMSAAVGHDKAVERLQTARKANAKSMDKLRKSLDGMGDLNKAMAVEQRLAAMQQEDARLAGALEQLGAVEEPVVGKAPAENFSQEIERLFPEGLPNVRAQVLADIARGQRFVWNDSPDGTKRGVATELGFAGNEGERRARFGMLGGEATGAKHVSRYVHDLWQDSNGYAFDMDDAALRDEVIDVLLATPSRASAMEQLRDMAVRHAEDDAAPRDVEDLAAAEAYDQERYNSRPEPVIAEQPGPDDVPFSVVGGASAAPAGVTPERWEVIVDQLRRVIGAENVVTDPEAVRAAYDDIVARGGNVRYSIRRDAPPARTGIGYKVFVLKNGQLYPPMVANPNGAATPVGVWLDADAAPVAGQSKTGRAQVKAGGKGTQGGSGVLAYRPGWHLGEIPYALQFNRLNPETGERELFPANFVWAEVEYANDVDYQEEAMSYGYNRNGRFQHSYAGLPRVPENGAYRYRTNPNPETDPWIITGAMRVKRLLKPSEVDAMVREAGRTPQQRQQGAVTDAQIEELNERMIRSRQQVADINERFNEQLEQLKEGTLASNVRLELGVPGSVLQASGINPSQIYLTQHVLRTHAEKHGLTTDDLRNLPAALENPIMVYEWGDKARSTVVITEIPRGNERIAVAVRLKSGQNGIAVNAVASVHGKSAERLLADMNNGKSDFAQNNLRYVNKKRTLDWLASGSFGLGISDQEFLSATNIITNFENPKIGPENIVPQGEETRYFRTPEGEVYGFTAGGKIYLDSERMNAATPMHEYTELWSQIVARENPELWMRGVELMKQTFVWDEVNADPNYKELSEELRVSETLSRMVADEFAGKQDAITDSSVLLGKLRAWMRKFWGFLKGTFAKWTKRELDDLTTKKFVQMPLRDFVEGIDLQKVRGPKPEPQRAAGHKQMQLEIIERYNPMRDDVHTGIRNIEDIKSFEEVVNEAKSEGDTAYPDIGLDMLEEAAKTGRITVYSSYPIKQGVFVSPSQMNAADYAGGGPVYRKEVSVDDVAWITSDEGQYAKVGSNSEARFSFIGERGAENLDKAEEASVRLDNLAAARSMETAGKDALAIKMATGWERGTDGKWRYEIPDIKVIRQPEMTVNRTEEGDVWYKTKLGKLIDAPELFTAYPQLAGIEVGIQTLPKGESGSYHNNVLILNIDTYKDKKEDVKKRIGEIERSAEYKEYSNVFDAEDATEAEMNMAMKKFFTSDIGKEYYDLMWGKGSTEKAFGKSARSVLSHEIQHAIQDIEGFARGGNLTIGERIAKQRDSLTDWQRNFIEDVATYESLKDTMREDYPLSRFMRNMAADEARYGESISRDIMTMDDKELRREYNRLSQASRRVSPGEAYFNIAGEVEARNVQKRLGMSAEERLASLAEETEDVARKDQIILREALGGGAASLANAREFTERRVTTLEKLENKRDALIADRGNIANFDEQIAAVEAEIEAYMQSDPVADTFGKDGAGDAHLQAVEDAVYDMQREINLPTQTVVVRNADEFIARLREMGATDEQLKGISPEHCPEGAQWRGEIVIRGDAVADKVHARVIYIHEQAHDITEALFTPDELYDAAEEMGADYMNKRLEERNASYHVDENSVESMIQGANEMISRGVDLLYRKGLLAEFFATENGPIYPVIMYMEEHGVPSRLKDLIVENLQNIKADQYGTERTRQNIPGEVERQLDSRLFPAREGDGTADETGGRTGTAGDAVPERIGAGAAGVAADAGGRIGGRGGDLDRPSFSFGDSGNDAPKLTKQQQLIADVEAAVSDPRNDLATTIRNFMPQVETLREALVEELEGDPAGELLSAFGSAGDRATAIGALREMRQALLDRDIRRKEEDARRRAERREYHEKVLNLYSRLTETDVEPDKLPQSVTSYIKTLVTPELMEVMGIRDFHSIATDIETALQQDKIQKAFAEYRKQRAHYRDIQQTETDPAVLESERQVMESAARTFADRVLASRPMQRIMDAVADMDLRLAKNRFDDLLRLKVEGLNASGVNTAKSVDENTRVFFKLLRDNLGLTEAQLQAKIDKLQDGNAVNPLVNFDGVMLHAMYRACLEEENNIDDLKSRLRKYSRESVRLYHVITGKSKGVSDALREEARANRATARRAIDATRAALVAAKSHLAGNYANLNQHLTSKLETGKTLFSDVEEARKRHQKHLVSEAVKAVKPDPGSKTQNADFPEGSRFVKGITSPFASFESTLQTVSINDPGRNGFLTQHFMLGPDGWAEANGQYQQRRSEILNGILAAFDRLVLHKKSDTSDRSLGKRLVERLERPFKETDTDDLFRYFGERLSDRDGNPVILETTSPEGSYYKSRSIVVTRGKALLWIAWGRQSELMPRLENIGLDREKLEILRSLLSKEDLAFLDWIQLELLPELLKERYNPVYRRMFGVDMDSTAWYFPFVANKNMVRQEVDMSQIESDGLPATITGSIIRRRHTMIEPDLDVDLMGVLTNHIGEMEHWAAFAPFISDINTLLSSPTFRNALESQQKGRYSAFKKVCFIAADAYRKFQPDPSEQFLTTLEKTCASAKIAWRGFTALKQVLSGVMFRTYTSDARFQKIVTRHLWDPFVTWKDWTWCMENLPSFRERWESRYAGDERLALKSPSRGRLNQAIFDHRGIQKTRRWFLRSFMYMNALVDAWVCARGARAVYLFEMERLQERGLDAGEADRQAKILAAIAMNTTQQSSEGAYMSVLQSDRTYMSATLSIFNNSSFAFGRIAQQAFKVLTMSKARREEVLEARKRYWIGRDLDETQATTRAREDMRRLMRDARLKLLLAGYLGNLIWNLFTPVMTAFVGGFNRDRDNRDSSYWRTWWNTLRNEVSWSTFVTPVFRNFVGGATTESFMNGYGLDFGLFISDMEKLVGDIKDAFQDFSPALALHLLGKVGALGLGVDFDTFVNMYKGAHKMFTRHETAAGIFQFLNSPKAILAAAEHSPGRGETDREYMERMAYAEGIAEEEMKRMETAPSYRLDDSERKVLRKMKKWERNYLAYRQASALGMSWERDKFGNVTIPELKRLDEDYESAVKWMGLTRSGEPVDELKKNWDSLGRQEEELTIDIIGRVHAIYPFERELENNVVFGDEYREQMKALVKLKQEVVALVENNK